MAATSGATDYYVCDCLTGSDGACEEGDNGDDGLSDEDAWQTLTYMQATIATASCGDNFYICEGGAGDPPADTKFYNSNLECNLSNPITVSSYDPTSWNPGAPGSLPNPIIRETATGDAFSFNRVGHPIVGYIFENLDLICDACADGTWGLRITEGASHLIFRNGSSTGFGLGANVATSSDAGRPHDITLDNWDMYNNKKQGFLGCADDLTITNSYYEGNGYADVSRHNIYAACSAFNFRGVAITNNESYHSAVGAGTACTGISIVVHGTVDGLWIAGNYVHEDNATGFCWGISVNYGYFMSEVFRNVHIVGNTLEDVGGIMIGLTTCIDCFIESNTLTMNASFPASFTAIKTPDNDATFAYTSLPACVAPQTNDYIVTDAVSDIRCDAGGGIESSRCRCNGSIYVPSIGPYGYADAVSSRITVRGNVTSGTQIGTGFKGMGVGSGHRVYGNQLCGGVTWTETVFDQDSTKYDYVADNTCASTPWVPGDGNKRGVVERGVETR